MLDILGHDPYKALSHLLDWANQLERQYDAYCAEHGWVHQRNDLSTTELADVHLAEIIHDTIRHSMPYDSDGYEIDYPWLRDTIIWVLYQLDLQYDQRERWMGNDAVTAERLRQHDLNDLLDPNSYRNTRYRDSLTELAISVSLCPIHFCDWASCFDDADPECEQVRLIFPYSHDT